MKFIYLDSHGDQVGPVDESVVVAEIKNGKLKANSPIRNALLREFHTVADFDCFAEALSQREPAKSQGSPKKSDGFIAYLRGLAREQIEQQASENIAVTRIPGDATAKRRTLAMLMDMLVLLPIMLLLFQPALTNMKKLGSSDTAELKRLRTARNERWNAIKLRALKQRNREKAAAFLQEVAQKKTSRRHRVGGGTTARPSAGAGQHGRAERAAETGQCLHPA